MSPLKENGPDPVLEKDVLTEEWLAKKLGSKRVPIKALLLDQANISGIGNWVGDEILYDAKIHPEQYSNTLSDLQLKKLHKSIHYVCGFAVDNLADSSKFPEEWLFKHRWQKGKKDSTMVLPNGSKIVFLTVGGRTSCVVPSVQKKSGSITDVAVADNKNATIDKEDIEKKLVVKAKRASKKRHSEVKEEQEDIVSSTESTSHLVGKKRKSKSKLDTNGDLKKAKIERAPTGRRRSARVSGKA